MTKNVGILVAALVFSASVQARTHIDETSPFIRNSGQWPTNVEFACLGGSHAFVGPDGLYLPTRDRAGHIVYVVLEWFGDISGMSGVDPLETRFSFFHGCDSSAWVSAQVGFDSVFLYGPEGQHRAAVRDDGGKLVMTIFVPRGRAGFDLELRGAASLDIPLAKGAHVIEADARAWGGTPDAVREVDLQVSADRISVAIQPSATATTVELSLVSSSYLGGPADDVAHDVLAAEDGSVVVVGDAGIGFPTTAGVVQEDVKDGTFLEPVDGFVARIDADGEFEFVTYLGSSDTDTLIAVAEASNGDLIVVGHAYAGDYPTTPGVVGETMQGLAGDFVVTRLNSTGTELVYSTYVGGSSLVEQPQSAALMPDEDVLLVGSVSGSGWPVTPGAFQRTIMGSTDGVVARLEHDGTALVFSTYLGGDGSDVARAVTGTPDGLVVVTGSTPSSDFPVSNDAFITSPPNSTNGFVTVFDGAGQLVASTYLGGSDVERPLGVAVGPAGGIYVCGYTESLDFPVTPGAFETEYQGFFGHDGFVVRMDPLLTTVEWGTYLGGGNAVDIDSLVVDGSGVVTTFGNTHTPGYVTTPGAYDSFLDGQNDFIVTRLGPRGKRVFYSTYLGGSSHEELSGVNVSGTLVPDGSVLGAGGTVSVDFPTTVGAVQPALAGGADAVVFHLSMLPTGVGRFGHGTPGCSGDIVLGVADWPQVGSTAFQVHASHAPLSELGGRVLIALDGLELPLGAVGAELWVDPATLITMLPIQSDAWGFAEMRLPIPDEALLAGLSVVAQMFWPDGCAAGGWASSNALRMTIQP